MVKHNKRRRNSKRNEGKVRNATPLKYYGIQFKSKLEVYTYKKLKQAGVPFVYEKNTFPLLEKFEYDGQSMEMFRRKGEKHFDWQKPNVRGITYTPDFVNMKQKWIIECKGNPNDAFPLKWKMFKRYMTDKYPGFTLYMPRNQKHVDKVIEHIKTKLQ